MKTITKKFVNLLLALTLVWVTALQNYRAAEERIVTILFQDAPQQDWKIHGWDQAANQNKYDAQFVKEGSVYKATLQVPSDVGNLGFVIYHDDWQKDIQEDRYVALQDTHTNIIVNHGVKDTNVTYYNQNYEHLVQLQGDMLGLNYHALTVQQKEKYNKWLNAIQELRANYNNDKALALLNEIKLDELQPITQSVIKVHYKASPEHAHAHFKMWVWYDGEGGRDVEFDGQDAWGKVATITVDHKVLNSFHLKLKSDNGTSNPWAIQSEGNIDVSLVDGKAEIWIEGLQASYKTQEPLSKIKVHFKAPVNDTEGWNMYTWGTVNGEQSFEFNDEDSFGKVGYLPLVDGVETYNLIVRQEKDGNLWHKQSKDLKINIKQGLEVWLEDYQGELTYEYGSAPIIVKDVELKVNYLRYDNAYEGWNIWSWLPSKDGRSFAFNNQHQAIVTHHDDRGISSVGLIVRHSTSANEWNGKNTPDDLLVTGFDASGKKEIWIIQNDATIYNSEAEIPKKIVHAFLSNPNELTLTVTKALTQEEVNQFTVRGYTVVNKTYDANKVVLELNQAILLTNDVIISHPVYGQYVLPLLNNHLHSKEFNETYYYDGTLGAIYTKDKTTFKLWAPTASSVKLIDYTNHKELPMKYSDKGVWQYEYDGNHDELNYRYRLTFADGSVNETVDPYARAVSVNGGFSVVVDSKAILPDNWDHKRMEPFTDETDAIIYEAHIRDLTIDADNGIVNKGKFLGLTEKNTKTQNGHLSGLSYLKSLGVTHIQFLPMYDFATVDEAGDLSFNAQYNWGYDPQNFNVPEGSYSSDPTNPKARIKEMKQMIEAIHEEGMYVIMDVVFNHVYNVENSPLHKTVPGYYFRYDENGNLYNGTGVGNETASEQLMYRKYMIDSLVYFATEYDIDGFRFDLMGIHDIETMQEIRKALNKVDPSIIILGEGWDMGNHPSGSKGANQYNAAELDGIAFFNDKFRDAVKGDNFNGANPGYINGENQAENAWNILNSLKSQHVVSYINPQQNVLYNEAHDNYTMYDKLVLSNPGDSDEVRMKRHTHATALQLLGNGMVFIHAGQETLRSKAGDHNSYKSSDTINHFDYDRAGQYPKALQYFKDLIKLRDMEPMFGMKSFEEINQHMQHIQVNENIVSYKLFDDKHTYIVISNANSFDVDLPVPLATYEIISKDLEVYFDHYDLVKNTKQLKGYANGITIYRVRDIKDIDTLEALIQQSEQLLKETKYTEVSINALKQYVTYVKGHRDEIDYVQEKVIEAIAKLRQLIQGLKIKGNAPVIKVEEDIEEVVTIVPKSLKPIFRRVLDASNKEVDKVSAPTSSVVVLYGEFGSKLSVQLEEDKKALLLETIQEKTEYTVTFRLHIKDKDNKPVEVNKVVEVTLPIEKNSFQLFNADGEEITEYKVEGNYVIFKTDKFDEIKIDYSKDQNGVDSSAQVKDSTPVLKNEKKSNSFLILVPTLGGVGVLLLLFVLLKRKK